MEQDKIAGPLRVSVSTSISHEDLALMEEGYQRLIDVTITSLKAGLGRAVISELSVVVFENPADKLFILSMEAFLINRPTADFLRRLLLMAQDGQLDTTANREKIAEDLIGYAKREVQANEKAIDNY